MSETPTGPVTLPLFVPKVKIRKKSTTTKVRSKIRKAVPVAKSFPHPWTNREDLSDAHELPVSQRETWWRREVKVTPVPGAYEETDFLKELSKKQNTYSFKAGNKHKVKDHHRSGLHIVPGCYEFKDFIQIMSQKPATYRFKDGQRFATDVLNFGIKDKDVDVAPNAYSTQKYLAIDGEKLPIKNYMFRSQTKRFSYIFEPRNIPSPTSYKVKDPNAAVAAVTSCFRSKTPRFPEDHAPAD